MYTDCDLNCEVKGRADILYKNGVRQMGMMLKFELSYKEEHEYFIVSEDGIRVSVGPVYEESAIPQTFSLSISIFKDYLSTHDYLWIKLGRLGLTRRQYPELAHLIMKDVDEVVRNPKIEHPNVFALNIKLAEHYIYDYSEEEYIESVSQLSRMEYEERRCGMVPTAEEFRILNSVKLGSHERQICTICLEELEDLASAMPCDHLFHGACIGKWLENSHYCPVCRYEMPIEMET